MARLPGKRNPPGRRVERCGDEKHGYGRRRFREADLRDADLTGSLLMDADFTDADLCGTKLDKTDQRGTKGIPKKYEDDED